jgi:type II secretory pathway pseudopilin PulG
MFCKSRSKAFSIVEVSIVLVISGLLMFTAFKGFGVIKKARVNSLVRQINEVTSGISAYREANGSLPGDTTSATAFELGSTAKTFTTGYNATVLGNGDGFIDYGTIGSAALTCTNNLAHESNFAWYQLFAGNYLSDSGITTSTVAQYYTNANPSTFTGSNQVSAATKVEGLYLNFFSNTTAIGALIPANTGVVGFKGNSLILGDIQDSGGTTGITGERVTAATNKCFLRVGGSTTANIINPLKSVLKGSEADSLDDLLDDNSASTGLVRSATCTAAGVCTTSTSAETPRTVAILLKNI